MTPNIKSTALKVATFALGLSMASFSFFASLVIFARTVEIIQNMYYTKPIMYGIIMGIGLVLIWLISLTASSAQWIVQEGFKKADQIKGE
mgnify:CR=1 FL=1|tara:strand:+ start:268 stop:537 length:270 start_codon:yes stop_codon:yes gene_type:complete